jgi:hypothetical protein
MYLSWIWIGQFLPALLLTNPRTCPKSSSSHTLFLEVLLNGKIPTHHLPEIESTVNEEMNDFKLKSAPTPYAHHLRQANPGRASISPPLSALFTSFECVCAWCCCAIADKRRTSLSLNQEICWPSGGRDQHWQHTTIMAQGHRLWFLRGERWPSSLCTQSAQTAGRTRLL